MTAPDVEVGARLGRALVEERLAACANVIPAMQSVYRWRGAIERAQEAVVILKTRSALVERLTQRVKTLHSYECPCVVAIPLSGGNEEFLQWITKETS